MIIRKNLVNEPLASKDVGTVEVKTQLSFGGGCLNDNHATSPIVILCNIKLTKGDWIGLSMILPPKRPSIINGQSVASQIAEFILPYKNKKNKNIQNQKATQFLN